MLWREQIEATRQQWSFVAPKNMEGDNMNFLEGFWEWKSGPRNWVPGFRATKLSFQLLWKTIKENQSSADVVAINPRSRHLGNSPRPKAMHHHPPTESAGLLSC
jgi:hypothetical protein